MPLFSDKFSPRLSKPRKSTGLNNLIGRTTSSSFGEESVDSLTDFKTLTIQLGDSVNLQFDETKGEWKLNQAESDDDGDGDDGNQEEDNGDNYGDENDNHDENGGSNKRKQVKSTKKTANSTSGLINSKSELAKLKKANETLLEENRLLKLKVELLVDLVIEKGESND